jgi:hypothetical protein
MSASLVRKGRRLIETPELRRRRRLTVWEHLVVYAPEWLFGSAWLGLAAGTLAIIYGPTLMDVAASVELVASIAIGVWAVVWFVQQVERGSSVMNTAERRFQVRADRNRRARAHRDAELGRIGGFDYDRYSVWVEREGDTLRLVALRHETTRFRPPTLLPWKASKTKKLFNSRTGSFDEDKTGLATIKIGEDDPIAKLQEAQEITEALEREAYAHALKNHQADCMAVALQPPPLSRGTQDRLEEARAHIDRLLQDGD